MTATPNRCLGRIPSRCDPRTIRLRDILARDLPPPPDSSRWDTVIRDWGTMGNDQYGNCVIATAGHMLLAWRAAEFADTTRISDAAVIALSREMGALNGYSILERLKYWRRSGMWSDRLWAYAAVALNNPPLVRSAISLFGAIDLGVSLAAAWQTQELWDRGSGRAYRPGSWGEHSVPIVGYDADYLYLVTWGAVQRMTWAALPYYCDEAYVCIDRNWIGNDAIAPSGLDLPALHAALGAIGAYDPIPTYPAPR